MLLALLALWPAPSWPLVAWVVIFCKQGDGRDHIQLVYHGPPALSTVLEHGLINGEERKGERQVKSNAQP